MVLSPRELTQLPATGGHVLMKVVLSYDSQRPLPLGPGRLLPAADCH